jgi:Na+/glutamate symporter
VKDKEDTMIEAMLVWLASQIPGLFVGGLAGILFTFFYIQHKLKSDPNWVENLYQKQRAISMKGTEAIEKENEVLKKQLEDFKAKELYDKLKADLIKEIKG